MDKSGKMIANAFGVASVIVTAVCCGGADTIPVAVEVPDSASFTFSDGFEAYSAGAQVSGEGNGDWTWTDVGVGPGDQVTVSDEIAYEGRKSLRFHFAGRDGWAWAEQRFVHTPVVEYWVEFYIYYPDGSEGLGAAYTHRTGSTTNNKFWVAWPEEYKQALPGGKPSVMFQTWKSGRNSRLDVARTVPDKDYMAYVPPDLPKALSYDRFIDVEGGADLGRWIQVRIHIRTADFGKNNGVVRFWKDGWLCDTSIADPLYDPYNKTNYFRNGYLQGWHNPGYAEDTNIYVDDFRFYAADPGW